MSIDIYSFASNLQLSLGSKLIGLLQIGSNANQDSTTFSDVDLILLGKDLEVAEFRAIRDIVRHIDFLIDMPIIQKDLIPTNPDRFQMGTHGCYFVSVLKSAKIIYGINFFESYPDPSHSAVRASIFRKIAEYAWVSQRTFVESNRERSLYQNYQMTSRLLKAAKDLLWLSDVQKPVNNFTAIETIRALQHLWKDSLTDNEWSVLRSIADPSTRNQIASNMSEEFLQSRVSIFEKIHHHASLIIENPQ